MKFDKQVAEQAAVNKQSYMRLPPELKDILVSQIIGRMSALLARRMDAKIVAYFQATDPEIKLIADDGTPLVDDSGELSKPNRIADSHYHRQNELVTILAEWDDVMAKALQDAYIKYERDVMAMASKYKGQRTSLQILAEMGPFLNTKGFWTK